MRRSVEGVALVKTTEPGQQLLTQGHRIGVWQNGAGKAAARKLLQQVHPHITPSADVAQKAMAAAWLNARPSVNLGKSSSMRATPCKSRPLRSASLGRRSTWGSVATLVVLKSAAWVLLASIK